MPGPLAPRELMRRACDPSDEAQLSCSNGAWSEFHSLGSGAEAEIVRDKWAEYGVLGIWEQRKPYILQQSSSSEYERRCKKKPRGFFWPFGHRNSILYILCGLYAWPIGH